MLLAAMTGSSAKANDSSAQLAAGGLVLTRSEAVEMQAEDLYISREAVRVRYRFRNTSGQNTTVRIAFPMPDIGGPDFFRHDVSVPVEAPANVLGFETRVDGKRVQTTLEQKALVDGVDRSAWLTAHRIPLAPHVDGTSVALAGLTERQRAEATKLGLLDEEGSPAWVLRSTYHWLQTFPANKPVVIEHHYKPSVGGMVMTGIGQARTGTPRGRTASSRLSSGPWHVRRPRTADHAIPRIG
jgi:hypothetical protein